MTHPYGPGVIVHGPDVNRPGRYKVQIVGDDRDLSLTPDEIAAHPIAHQWFTGTKLGLLASWATREVAENYAASNGTMLGQIVPVTIAELAAKCEPTATIVVLCDPWGRVLPGRAHPLGDDTNPVEAAEAESDDRGEAVMNDTDP